MTDIGETRCLNCGTVVGGQFCSECGQPASTRRLQTSEVFVEIAKKISNLDSRVWNTVIGLTTHPGRVCRDYVEGKRIGYVPPLRYCMVVLATVILWYAFIGVDLATASPDFGFETSEKTRAVRQVVGTYVAKHLNVVVIAAIPIYAAIVALLFRRSGMNYAEVVAFVLYVMAHIMLLALMLSFFRAAAPTAVMAVRIAFQVVFFSWAAAGFFRVSPIAAAAKTIVATLFYFIIVGIMVFVFAFPKVSATLKNHDADAVRRQTPAIQRRV